MGTIKAIVNVPSEFPTIQEAVNSCTTSDTILLAQGIYNEGEIIIDGERSITLASNFIFSGDQSDIENTIIDSTSIRFEYGTDNSSVEGLTIQNYSGTEYDEAALFFDSKITVTNNIFKHNSQAIGTMFYMGPNPGTDDLYIIENNIFTQNIKGVFSYSFIVNLRNNTFDNNEVGVHFKSPLVTKNSATKHIASETNFGIIEYNKFANNIIGAKIEGNSITIKSNTFENNGIGVKHTSGYAPHIFLITGSIKVIENLFISNLKGIKITTYNYKSSHRDPDFTTAYFTNNIVLNSFVIGLEVDYGTAVIRNSIFWNNELDFYDQDSDYTSSIGNCLFDISSEIPITWSDMGENLTLDPKFIDPSNGNFHLQENSPCIDAGSDNDVFNDIEDPNNQGFALYPSLGTTRNDMGIYGGNGFTDYVYSQWVDIDESSLLVDNHTLHQNYPNPFNPSTTISFDLRKEADVNLTVFNSNGEIVNRLLDRNMKSGNHTINFNAEKLNSGVYFYRLSVDGVTQSRKMILVK